MKKTLKTKLGPLVLKNPVVLCAGTFGYGEEISAVVDISKIGAVIPKTLTLKPKLGNLPPRIKETPCGLINSIGLENIGIESFLKDKLPFLRKKKASVIVSIAGEKKKEFIEIAKILDSEEISAIELNISCPNVGLYGKSFSQDENKTYEIVYITRKYTTLPLIVKLSPNVTDMVKIAKAAKKAGADILSLVNTFRAVVFDIKRKRPFLGNVIGGLSGPCIKPLALYYVYIIKQHISIPIIGMGGITTVNDAIEFFLAGADAVGIGTASFINPKVSLEIINKLSMKNPKSKYYKIPNSKGFGV